MNVNDSKVMNMPLIEMQSVPLEVFYRCLLDTQMQHQTLFCLDLEFSELYILAIRKKIHDNTNNTNKNGHSATWDVTVTNTVAGSYIGINSARAAAAAEAAVQRK